MPFTEDQLEQGYAYMEVIFAARLNPKEFSKTAEKKGYTPDAYEKEALDGLQRLLVDEINLDDDDSIIRMQDVNDAFKSFIATNGLDLNKDSKNRILAIIKLMVQIHINENPSLEQNIILAARLGSVGCFRLLKKLHGVNWRHKIAMSFGDCTALHVVACTRGTEIIEFWRNQKNNEGFNIDIRDARGATPLFYAARENAIEMARYLCRHGAEVNATDEAGCTPLIQAVMSEHADVDMLYVLIAHGADVNAESVGEDFIQGLGTALDNAVRRDAIRKTWLLLENGGCLSERSGWSLRNFSSPRQIALLDDFEPREHPEIDSIFDSLLRPGTNPAIPQRKEDTVLDDKAKQQGQIISRIARVRQILQEKLPALFAAGAITAEEQIAATDKIINKLESEDLRAECHTYCRQQQQAQAVGQDPAAIVPPWAHYKIGVLAFPSESKEMGATSTTTSAPDQLPADAKKVIAETKEMPRANPVSSADQTCRDNEVSSSATGGYSLSTIPAATFSSSGGGDEQGSKTSEQKPADPDAPQPK